MGIRPVCRFPERVLKVPAAEVGGPPPAGLVEDLIDTMRASPACVGLAAPQIGESQRVIAVDVTGHPKATACHGLIVLSDPQVIDSDGRVVGREGCMSVPHFTANVARCSHVVVKGRAAEGIVVVETEGFEARALQHEIDHLDGMLILDRVQSLATDVFRRRVYE